MQGKGVFQARFVKVGEVGANSQLSILLFNNDDVGQPVGVFHLVDGASAENPFDFVVNDFSSLGAELAPFLFNRFEIQINYELM